MSLAITFADSQNATGGVLSITGSAGSANVVFAQLVGTAGPNQAAFVQVGTRTGDGTVALTLDVGYYWIDVIANGVTLSNRLYCLVSDNAQSVRYRSLLAIQATLQGMTFAAGPSGTPAQLQPAQVYLQFFFDTINKSYPCIVINIDGQREQQQGNENNTDDILTRVELALLDTGVSRQTGTERLPTYSLWRQQIARRFRQSRLFVPESTYVTLEYGPELINDDKKPGEFQGFASLLTIQCKSREIRG